MAIDLRILTWVNLTFAPTSGHCQCRALHHAPRWRACGNWWPYRSLRSVVPDNVDQDPGRSVRGRLRLLESVPNPTPTALLIQMTMFDQIAKVLLQRVPADARQFDGIANRDAPMLASKFDDLQ